MNRRSFIGSTAVATACALNRRSLSAKASSQLDQVRARLGIEGPIVLRGGFYLGYCPIYLHGTTIVRSPLGESVCMEGCGYRYSKAMAHDLLQAITLDRFSNPSGERNRYGLVFILSGSIDRYPMIIGRDKAWSFRKRLPEWFHDVRLELPKRDGSYAYE